ncbi:unnamed protein product [Acanthoscelides obtectus]|uniref:Uncharacterized protein n=1 Tax=Acanthoscelides obtectus TaxID=200917 RepID=A0A9P0NYQ1_ACAOB|nr:unnamed protein product [Acanthoscelides obtectus]CAK1631642.1 hypothetical protein AOBTE_LOCUS7065 [Acanthoscelides obtectus]
MQCKGDSQGELRYSNVFILRTKAPILVGKPQLDRAPALLFIARRRKDSCYLKSMCGSRQLHSRPLLSGLGALSGIEEPATTDM